MTTDNLQQRRMLFDVILGKAQSIYAQRGVSGVAELMKECILDTSEVEDTTYLRLSACTRAEGHSMPTVSFLKELCEQVKVSLENYQPTEDRQELIAAMMAQISADLCNELVSKTLWAANMIAKSLGSSIDISASGMGPNDSEWKSLHTPGAGQPVYH